VAAGANRTSDDDPLERALRRKMRHRLRIAGKICFDGGGAFGAPTTFGAGSQIEGLAVGAFKGDGKPDVATANFFGRRMSLLTNTAPPKAH